MNTGFGCSWNWKWGYTPQIAMVNRTHDDIEQ